MKKTRAYFKRIGSKGGKIGGQSTSAAKLEAIAENAKKGGWPKGKPRKKKA